MSHECEPILIGKPYLVIKSQVTNTGVGTTIKYLNQYEFRKYLYTACHPRGTNHYLKYGQTCIQDGK